MTATKQQNSSISDMQSSLKNVVVVGGSYVGIAAAQQLAAALPATHRVLLVEPHSHFHHLFAFPRFAVVPKHEHKAFIPYTHIFKQPTIANPDQHLVVRAKVNELHPNHITLDRQWQGSSSIPFSYLAVATGTKLPSPGSMSSDEKVDAIEYFKIYQEGVKKAQKIVILGGGAVGVQMATDLKEYFPEKEVTLVQSRDRVMPKYHEALHGIIKKRFDELGVNLITGNRLKIPEEGFPIDGREFEVELNNGTKLNTQLVILATGQIPNNQLLHSLPSTSSESLTNPENGFIRVRPTLQFQDPAYSNLFALGDIADSGAHKAARPGSLQAAIVAKNIAALAEGKEPVERVDIGPAAIHMSLGLKQNVVFRNPTKDDPNPMIKMRDDGSEDMGIEGVWARRGVIVTGPDDYHL